MYSLSIFCSISKSTFSVAADSFVDWIYYCKQGICSSGFKIKEMNKRNKKSKLWLASYIKSFQVQHKHFNQRQNQDGYAIFLTRMPLKGQAIGLSESWAYYSNRKNSRQPPGWSNNGWDQNTDKEEPIYSIKKDLHL